MSGQLPTKLTPTGRILTAEEFRRLADVPLRPATRHPTIA